jgi:hypothetical protein
MMPAGPQPPEPPTRRALIAAYAAALAVLHGESTADAPTEDADAARERAHADIERVVDAYLALLPRVPVARCPFTGTPLRPVLDPWGLDGPYWSHDAPERLPIDDVPATFLGLAGALHPAPSPLERTSWLVAPGPEVPWVDREVLEHPDIRLVVNAVRIGAHQGYALAYFGAPGAEGLIRVNTWGTNDYRVTGEAGEMCWGERQVWPERCDFDLDPWIRAGKLLWIEPGDGTLTLRSTVTGCPYLDLPGRREPIYLQHGELWCETDLIDEGHGDAADRPLEDER